MRRGIAITGLTGALLAVMLLIPGGCAESAGGGSAGATRQDVEKALHTLERRIEPGKKYDSAAIYLMLEEVLQKNQRIFGAAWAIPQDDPQKADLHYMFVDGGTLVTRSEPAADTGAEHMGWYRIPLRSGSAGWSRPYQIDDGMGNRLSLITYSLPVFDQNRPTAVIACDYLIKKEAIR